MKRSIIMTSLMGLLLAGQTVQAANKISSVRVGFLQKEYRTANQERKNQILKQLEDGGYPAVAKQLQSGAQPAPIKKPAKKQKPTESMSKEEEALAYLQDLFNEQEEVKQAQQEVNKELANAAKAEEAIAEKQAKAREEEAKEIKTLENEKQRLEQQGREAEAAKKAKELEAAKQKQLQDELKRAEEAKKVEAERQRLENEQRAQDEQLKRLEEEQRKAEEQKRAEALTKEQSEKNLAAILKAGETELPEFKKQLAGATTVRESEMVIAGVHTFWTKTIKKMPGFKENENDQAVQNLYEELRKVQTAAEAKRDDIRKAAGKEKEEEKTIPSAPVSKPGEAGKKPIGLKEEIEEKAKKQRLEAIERMESAKESAKMKATAEQKVEQLVQNAGLGADRQIAALNAEINTLNAALEKGRRQRLSSYGNKGLDGITYDNHDEMVKAQKVSLSDFGSNDRTNKENYHYYLALHNKLKELRESNPAGWFVYDATELEF